MNHWQLKEAVRCINNGGVIAYPTEAVWGLGCDPYNRQAVQRLLDLKRRPEHKGLILVAADEAQIEPLLAVLTDSQRQCLRETWPGPNTWLLPDPKNLIPHWVKGRHAQVAVRVSAHPLVQALCRAYGGPLISTSANRSAADPARSKLKVSAYFGCKLDFILPGELGGLDKPTVIRSLVDMNLVRA
ncbi:L-threonylcarbamoyladenylate synthase [Marinobacterium sediminicola]|uniref:Threonylcarbamoyl-AMP synthase n=1 Tax=Marinobacterium sediminicola TaxID=518898 RepID=A0ABY1S3B7_9GAMM|nr:L-threonylcarbamoyladenylate synthase [Marinobacterium sediminicola]ULG69254.1 threonylcarbamoyl-AMP synthase [Marinobacterium sediminicola]SMR77602.1 L-threonylcarbamoyladenylate synthase [Marinobacterium sediminicola]